MWWGVQTTKKVKEINLFGSKGEREMREKPFQKIRYIHHIKQIKIMLQA